jgi:uncharacterized protein (TIGR03437 family)
MRSLILALALAPGAVLAGDPAYTVTTIAGGEWAGDGLPAPSASLGSPEGLVIDGTGAIYIADSLDHRVRKVTSDGRIATVAGTGRSGFSGDGGPASEARLNQPYGLALDAGGNLFVADLGNARVRRVATDGTITTFAGGGETAGGNAVNATSARLVQPRDLAFDRQGNLFISDFGGHRVYRVAPSGVISPVAGIGGAGRIGELDNIPALFVPLDSPAGLAVDAAGRLYIADSGNRLIRVVANGTLSTVRGTAGLLGSPVALAFNAHGVLHAAGKLSGIVASLGGRSQALVSRPDVFEPRGLAFAPDGSLHIADRVPGERAAGVVRKLASGDVRVAAGDGAFRSPGDGRKASMAHVESPEAVAADTNGNVYISQGDGRIRKLKDGLITTIATAPGATALAVDSSGNVWVAQRALDRVLKLGASGKTISAYPIKAPEALAATASGDVFAAAGGGVVWKITPAGTASIVARAGELCGIAAGADGTVYLAERESGVLFRLGPNGEMTAFGVLESPGRIAVTPSGGVVAVDTLKHSIRQVSAEGSCAIAGTGAAAGFGGDGGPALDAQFAEPSDVAADSLGNLYVADRANNRIRQLTPATLEPPTGSVEVSAIANAASMLPGPVVAGALITLFGAGIGPQAAVYGALETKLAGFDVLFDGEAAPLLYVQSRQVNLQAPYSVAGREQVKIEIREAGETKVIILAPVAAAGPALFTVADSTGPVAASHPDKTSNSALNPAPAGSVVTFWATGEGATTPAGVTGRLAGDPLPSPVLPVTLKIGGFPAEVLYAGAAPGFAGLMQVNARVPERLTPGTHDIELTVGRISSQPGVTVFTR